MPKIIRITPSKLGEAQRAIFGEHRVTGPAIAASAGLQNVTLWSFLNRTGLPVEVAEKLSSVLRARAAKLLEAAECLSRGATIARREALEVPDAT